MAAGSAEPARALDARAFLVVAALTALGAVLRLVVAHQSLFADELSTFWIITEHGLRGVVSTVHTDAEITPPLYFVLSWATAKLGHAPELVRAPSLVAGIATIPLMYLLGLRTVGRSAALVATAITALGPFMVYYSAEARAYALMMAFVVATTLALLLAVDTGRRRWWAVYAVCMAAAVYSHYTCVFLFGALLVWILWTVPTVRRPALVSTAAAVVLFLPWASGLRNDFSSPTSTILSALSPFTFTDVRVALEHWSVGYPYSTLGLQQLPGRVGLAMLFLGVLLATLAVVRPRRPSRDRRWAALDDRLTLVVLLLISVPVGEALVSSVSTHLFGVRNLAASWPPLALALGALLTAPGPRVRVASVALVLAGFGIGAEKLLHQNYSRPDYRAATEFVMARAAPGDVVIDATGVLSPGPLTPLDATWHGRLPVIRAGAPAERDHPFTVFDRIVPLDDAIRAAVATAAGHRIFLVQNTFQQSVAIQQRLAALRAQRFPAPYRGVSEREYPSFVGGLRVSEFAARTPGGG
jgi:hypothetical protein